MTTGFNEVEILLVEDDPNDSELTVRVLKKNNLANKVHVVRDGEEALDFIFGRNKYAAHGIDFPPKVVFLDLKLPKVSGLEVLKKVKSDDTAKMIPVVVVTSSQETQDIEKCYQLGVNSFVQKPIEFNDFVKAISELGLYWMAINKTV